MSDSKGIARNTIDEQKSRYGAQTSVDRDVGKKFPTSSSNSASGASSFLPEIRSGGQTWSESVDEALKGAQGLATERAQKVDDDIKVGGGEREDLHSKAAAKQP